MTGTIVVVCVPRQLWETEPHDRTLRQLAADYMHLEDRICRKVRVHQDRLRLTLIARRIEGISLDLAAKNRAQCSSVDADAARAYLLAREVFQLFVAQAGTSFSSRSQKLGASGSPFSGLRSFLQINTEIVEELGMLRSLSDAMSRSGFADLAPLQRAVEIQRESLQSAWASGASVVSVIN